MELDMKKEKHSGDKISEQTLHEILLDIKYRLDHIEDMEADNRSFIVKLIKQGNSIVKFLANIDVEPIEENSFPIVDKKINNDRIKHIKELVDEFMNKHKELRELEEELEKYKDDITPGQVGES